MRGAGVALAQRSVPRDAACLLFLSGRATSLIGTQITFFALPAGLVLKGAAASTVALFETLTVCGSLLVGLFVGAVADRVRPSRLLVACDLLRCVLMGASGMVLAWGSVTALILLAALTLLMSLVTTQAEVSLQVAITSLAAGERRARLNARLQTAQSTAQLSGPPLAGAIVSAFGGAFALALDGMSYLVSAIFTRLCGTGIDPPKAGEGDATDGGMMWATRTRWFVRQSVDGLRLLRADTTLLAITLSVTTANFFSGLYGAAFVYFVLEELSLTTAQLGLIGLAGSLGGVVASLVCRLLFARLGYCRVLRYTPLAYTTLALVAAAPPHEILWPMVGAFAYAFAAVTVAVAAVIVRQDRSPASAVGRIAAASRLLTWGVYPLSGLAAALLLVLLTARAVVWIAVAGESLSALILLLWPSWWTERQATASGN
jgi:hypothetical protein